ncbi:MAG TPA: DUF445 domain-containing protein [Dermatophilaceae bacterium]|nr:DUF445 domain-containing protein [Dermatophilaceae bacterium]
MPPDLNAADEQRRSGLRRMRLVALSLLLFAAVLFLLTHGRDGAWGFVNAGAEAAMVGALADWFAVTALFRHPLGLPVPHTAIIPTRKQALGQSLEDFVVGNFLTEAAVRHRVAVAQVARRVGGWLAVPAHTERVLAEVSRQVVRGLRTIREEQVRDFVTGELLPRVAAEPLSPVAGTLLESIVRDGSHHGLVDLVVTEAHDWLAANSAQVDRIVRARAPWWTPPWLDDRVVNRVYAEGLTWVREIRDQLDHPVRKALDGYLRQLAADLQEDPSTMRRFEALKARLLTHPQLGPTVQAVWASVRTAAVTALEDPDSALRGRLRGELTRFGQRLVDEPELQARVDGHLGDGAAYVARTYGREIAAVISHTVDRWDGAEAAERIELHVGRDLQFIRINGTVVGALVGLAIHAVSLTLG